MANDWFRLHRQILQSAVFADAELLRLWIWALARANWRDSHLTMRTGRGTAIVTCKRGEFVTGRDAGSKELKWSPSTFRDRLKRLESLGMITVTPDRHWSVVSIVNYDKFQSVGEPETTGNQESSRQANPGETAAIRSGSAPVDVMGRQPSDNQATTKRQATANQTTTKRQPNDNQTTQSKNSKKVKNTKKKDTSFFDPLKVELPTSIDNPRFRESWSRWIKHRIELKKPLTESTTEMLVKRFATWGASRSVAAIDHTVESGWVGIREPNEDERDNSSPDATPKGPRLRKVAS